MGQCAFDIPLLEVFEKLSMADYEFKNILAFL